MDDFSFWWYIIAAVIYFLTRGRKKQPQKTPGSDAEKTPPRNQPKPFEELLKEITEGRISEEPEQQPVEIDTMEEASKHEESIRLEGERRAFADDESKRVYEESIKMAEGADIKFERDEHFQETRLFKKKADEMQTKSYAEELMDGFDVDEAKKAVVYSEIFNRKY